MWKYDTDIDCKKGNSLFKKNELSLKDWIREGDNHPNWEQRAQAPRVEQRLYNYSSKTAMYIIEESINPCLIIISANFILLINLGWYCWRSYGLRTNLSKSWSFTI